MAEEQREEENAKLSTSALWFRIYFSPVALHQLMPRWQLCKLPPPLRCFLPTVFCLKSLCLFLQPLLACHSVVPRPPTLGELYAVFKMFSQFLNLFWSSQCLADLALWGLGLWFSHFAKFKRFLPYSLFLVCSVSMRKKRIQMLLPSYL